MCAGSTLLPTDLVCRPALQVLHVLIAESVRMAHGFETRAVFFLSVCSFAWALRRSVPVCAGHMEKKLRSAIQSCFLIDPSQREWFLLRSTITIFVLYLAK